MFRSHRNWRYAGLAQEEIAMELEVAHSTVQPVAYAKRNGANCIENAPTCLRTRARPRA